MRNRCGLSGTSAGAPRRVMPTRFRVGVFTLCSTEMMIGIIAAAEVLALASVNFVPARWDAGVVACPPQRPEREWPAHPELPPVLCDGLDGDG